MCDTSNDRSLGDFDPEQYTLEEWFMLSEYFDKGSVEVTVLGDAVNFDIHSMGINVKSIQMSLPKGCLDFSDSEMMLTFSRKSRAKSQSK